MPGSREGRAGTQSMRKKGRSAMPLKGDLAWPAWSLGYPVLAWRSGRVAEGGALLRRYGGTNLHRGLESVLLRFCIAGRGGRAVEWGGLESRFGPLGASRVRSDPTHI